MILEQLRAECSRFQGDRECYIHCEKPQNGQFALLIGGNPMVMLSGIFFILCRMGIIMDVPVRELIGVLSEMKSADVPPPSLSAPGRMERKTQSESFSQEKKRMQSEIEMLKTELAASMQLAANARREQAERYKELSIKYDKVCKYNRGLENKVERLMSIIHGGGENEID